jgi:uncharacterized protein (DUF2147 family)
MTDKKILSMLVVVGIFFGGFTIPCLASAAETTAMPDLDSPKGLWKTIDDKTGKAKSFIKIWIKDGKLYGKITKLINPSEEDPLCDKCEGALHNKPVIGMTIMKGLTQDGDEWNGGRILDPESGKTYKCLIEVQNSGKRLKVRGYIGFSLLGRTQHWYRVK